MLMVTTTMGMLHRVHSHTTHLNASVTTCKHFLPKKMEHNTKSPKKGFNYWLFEG